MDKEEKNTDSGTFREIIALLKNALAIYVNEGQERRREEEEDDDDQNDDQNNNPGGGFVGTRIEVEYGTGGTRRWYVGTIISAKPAKNLALVFYEFDKQLGIIDFPKLKKILDWYRKRRDGRRR